MVVTFSKAQRRALSYAATHGKRPYVEIAAATGVDGFDVVSLAAIVVRIRELLGLAHRLDDHDSRVLQYCATATVGTISEGQEAHLPLPFALEAALGHENQIVDSPIAATDLTSKTPGIG